MKRRIPDPRDLGTALDEEALAAVNGGDSDFYCGNDLRFQLKRWPRPLPILNDDIRNVDIVDFHLLNVATLNLAR
jgi:hypothetical protein